MVETSTNNLEEILVNENLVTQDQMSIAKESQKNLGDSLEQVLIDRGFVTENQILKAVSKNANVSYLSLSRYQADPEALKLLPVDLIKKFKVLPLFKIEDKVTLATANPTNLIALDEIRSALNCDIEPLFALSYDIERIIKERFRGQGVTTKGVEKKLEIITTEETSPQTEQQTEVLEKDASGESVVNAVNNIFLQSIEDNASDIHLEPTRTGLNVRLRLDGILEEFTTLPKSLHQPVISRVKIMGNMDVAENRIPQDGRIRLKLGDKEIDVRVATYPTMFGEAAAIRLLSKEQLITLEQLGFLESDLDTFSKLINKPHGILLVTGPTGSGKTTTLYASLMRINSRDKHILSIEDPVENEIEGVDQQQVNLKAGMTFPAALRAMLRQDPDIIMVGEIRDLETADIAMRAAMTGHMVFSTLHTNSSLGAISRLLDLGIEPYLISSSLIGVMAQRLVRKICARCKEEITLPEDKLKLLPSEFKVKAAFQGKGCKYCRQTGYSGRVGLFEILTIDDDTKQMINSKRSETEISNKLSEKGFHSILSDGINKINQGLTTLDEILRVTEA